MSIERGNGGGNIGGLNSTSCEAESPFGSALGGGDGSLETATVVVVTTSGAGAVVEAIGIGGGATGVNAAGAGVGVCITLMLGDCEEGVVGTLSSGMDPDLLRRTLVNLRLAGRYSQFKPTDSHLLHLGRSPEHFVFCEWHWLQARWARLRRVPASVRFCEGLILEILSFGCKSAMQQSTSQSVGARALIPKSGRFKNREGSVTTHLRTGSLHPQRRDR